MDSIRSVDEAPSIESAFRYFFKNRRYTDFMFISKDGHETHVHKLVLALHSHKLSQIAYSSSGKNYIRIETVDNLALENMISYFYNERVTLGNISDIRQAKILADKYEITGLIKICKNAFSQMHVELSDVLTVLETAKDFKDEAKEKECIALIGKNQETVFTSPLFNQMNFQKVLNIFERLRDMNMMKETVLLRSAISWLETNKSTSKKNILMEKVKMSNIPLFDYLDIMQSYPKFFEGSEITAIVAEIRSKETTQVKTMSPGREIAPKRYRTVETNTEPQGNDGVKRKITPSADKDSTEKPKQLLIKILKEDDGVNVFGLETRARITIQDNVSARSLQVGIGDTLKKGLLGTVAEKKADYTYLDVDISYEGVYYMIRALKDMDPTLTPTQYVEVLKAALHFQLQDLSDKCIMSISSIQDYDPVFLDGLRKLPYFEDKCLPIILSSPLSVILHPNFINCSADLIILIFTQDELKVKCETQLLLVLISWLEVRDRDRRHFRSTLLCKLAFENISAADFKYVVLHNPNFFTSEEKEYILAYRNAIGAEIRYFRDKLPEWYNFKSRKFL